MLNSILAHWGREKMAANFLTTISNAFSWMKVYINYDYDFIEVCSQGSNQQYSSIGSDNGLSLGLRQAIIWTNAGIRTNHGLLFWIINVSLGPNELMKTKHICIFYRFWKLKRGKLKSFIIGRNGFLSCLVKITQGNQRVNHHGIDPNSSEYSWFSARTFSTAMSRIHMSATLGLIYD